MTRVSLHTYWHAWTETRISEEEAQPKPKEDGRIIQGGRITMLVSPQQRSTFATSSWPAGQGPNTGGPPDRTNDATARNQFLPLLKRAATHGRRISEQSSPGT